MATNRYYSFAREGTTAQIDIYGDITSWPWPRVRRLRAQPFQAPRRAEDVDTIEVNITSYGGEVAEGLAIYNALKRHSAKVITRCDGFACSIASVIFSAGDERVMHDASLLMIHNAWTQASGNASDLRKLAEDLESITQASKNAYMANVSIDEDELTALMDAETWIAPADAVEMGFATGIESFDAKAPSQSARNAVFSKLSAKGPELASEPDSGPTDAQAPQEQGPAPEPAPTPIRHQSKNLRPHRRSRREKPQRETRSPRSCPRSPTGARSSIRPSNSRTTRFANQLAEAYQSGDAEAMTAAWEAFGDSVYERVASDFNASNEGKDAAVLAQRGYRTLTQKETKYFSALATALKAAKSKQSFIDILGTDEQDDVMPETTFNDVFKYLAEERPLLKRIRFQNAGYTMKWIINDNTAQRGSWGEIDDKITAETGARSRSWTSRPRYSAFCVIPIGLLDMGPQFLDSFIRQVMAEAWALGIEEAIVSGTGVNMPVGLTRNPNSTFSQETGYEKKTPVKIISFAPKEYGETVNRLVKTEKGKNRSFGQVQLLCNQSDYLTKVMPATTALNASGQYATNLFPFPTEVIVSNVLQDGEAVLAILDEYTLAAGGNKNGQIEFDDSIGFLDHARTFRFVQYAMGRAYDNTSAILLDISELDPAYITVKSLTATGDEQPVA